MGIRYIAAAAIFPPWPEAPLHLSPERSRREFNLSTLWLPSRPWSQRQDPTSWQFSVANFRLIDHLQHSGCL